MYYCKNKYIIAEIDGNCNINLFSMKRGVAEEQKNPEGNECCPK